MRGPLLRRDYAPVICYFGKVFNVYMWVMVRLGGVGSLKIEDG
jgi:hypothetical protein